MPRLVNHLVKWKGRFFFPDPQKMSEFIEVLAAVKGGNGYVPYYVLGNFSVRTDVPPVKGTRKLSDLNLWTSDPEFVWENSLKILEFWVANWN